MLYHTLYILKDHLIMGIPFRGFIFKGPLWIKSLKLHFKQDIKMYLTLQLSTLLLQKMLSKTVLYNFPQQFLIIFESTVIEIHDDF